MLLRQQQVFLTCSSVDGSINTTTTQHTFICSVHQCIPDKRCYIAMFDIQSSSGGVLVPPKLIGKRCHFARGRDSGDKTEKGCLKKKIYQEISQFFTTLGRRYNYNKRMLNGIVECLIYYFF